MKKHMYDWMMSDPMTVGFRDIGKLDLEQKKAWCLSDYPKTKNFHPDEIIDFPYPDGPVLDFGCGPGRNVDLLRGRFKSVCGYDLPEVVDNLPDDIKQKYAFITGDWMAAQQNTIRFSCIYCAIVLQHIRQPWLRCYLEDFQTMTDYLHLTTRWYSDDGNQPIMPVILDYFLPVDPLFSISQALRPRKAPEDQSWFRLVLKSRKPMAG